MDLQVAYNIIDRAVEKAQMSRNDHIQAQQALSVFKNLILSVQAVAKESKEKQESDTTQANPVYNTTKSPQAGEGN